MMPLVRIRSFGGRGFTHSVPVVLVVWLLACRPLLQGIRYSERQQVTVTRTIICSVYINS